MWLKKRTSVNNLFIFFPKLGNAQARGKWISRSNDVDAVVNANILLICPRRIN
jgi:hypothetical protein